MARYRRSLEDALRDMSGQARTNAGLTLSTPEMQELAGEYIAPEAIDATKLAPAYTADIDQRISDAAASIVTAERIAAGAVTANSIADFALTVKKFHSDRHHLY